MRALPLLLLLLTACHETGPRSAAGAVGVEPQRVGFGSVPLGARRVQHLRLTNGARFPVTVSLSVAAPFHAPAQVELGAGAEQQVEVTFAPEVEGPAEGGLTASWEGERSSVALDGEGLPSDACAPAKACEEAVWDPVAGLCVRSSSANGSACSDACLTEGTCVDGTCVGAGLDCDDGDACTIDACDPATGCAHAPLSCPGSDDPCFAAACDPVAGCQISAVPDGTACGLNDCATAHVCINGSCVSRPAADGSRCGAFSPCQGPGTCQAGSCLRPPATALTPRWSYSTGSPLTRLATGSLSSDGHYYAVEVRRGADRLEGAWLLDFELSTGAVLYRQPVLQSGGFTTVSLLLLEGDTVVVGYHGQFGDVVAGFDRRTGTSRWSREVTPALIGLDPSVQTELSSAFERAPGSVVLLVNAWEWDSSMGTWAAQIDPATGSVLDSSRVGTAAETAPVADETGAFGFGDVDYLSVLRWIQPDGGQLALAAGDMRFFPKAAWSGTVVWVEAGAGQAGSLWWRTPDGGTRQLAEAGAPLTDFVLGRAGAFGAVTPGDGGTELLSFDPAGDLRARFPLPRNDLYRLQFSAPVLTSDDGALFSMREEWANTTWLFGYSPERQDFACVLDGGVEYPGIAGLSKGLVLVLEQPLGAVLEAYDVGPLDLATSGWVCAGGNPHHSLRALP